MDQLDLPTFRLDHFRLVTAAAHSGQHEQCSGMLIDYDDDGRARYCFEGVVCRCAHLDGHLGLASDAFSRLPLFVAAGPSDHAYGDATEAASRWLGFDLTTPLDLDRCPPGLRSRVQAAVASAPSRYLPTRVDDPAVWVLNDAGVSLGDIADVLRCHLGVDTHLVAGTPEHDAVTRLAAREDGAWARAAELDPWGADATEAILAVVDVWGRALTEHDARRAGPSVYGSYVQALEAAVNDADDCAAIELAAADMLPAVTS